MSHTLWWGLRVKVKECLSGSQAEVVTGVSSLVVEVEVMCFSGSRAKLRILSCKPK